jgi:hypothetical protein
MSISPSDLPLIQGTWFDGRSARACAAALRPQSADLCWLEAEAQQREVVLIEVSVSARIGQIPRRLTFADGSYFETADNDGIDVLMAARGSSRGWVPWLERQWKVALLALLGVAGICILLVTVVLPRLATRIADAVPTSVDAQIGAGVLRTLDGRLLLPSDWFADDGRECAWDLLELKTRYATASPLLDVAFSTVALVLYPTLANAGNVML